MMKPPTEFQLNQLAHIYDPVAAHEYYMRIRKLKGRKKGSQQVPQGQPPRQSQQPPPHRKAKGTISPREQQKAKLKANITNLQLKLQNLEELIKKKEATLAKDQQLAKSKANQNHKGKQKGPKTAAQKAAQAHKNKQYQQAHKQQLKNKAQQRKGAGGGGKGSKASGAKPDSQKSIAELKTLATKVRGLLVVAQQKLAAL